MMPCQEAHFALILTRKIFAKKIKLSKFLDLFWTFFIIFDTFGDIEGIGSTRGSFSWFLLILGLKKKGSVFKILCVFSHFSESAEKNFQNSGAFFELFLDIFEIFKITPPRDGLKLHFSWFWGQKRKGLFSNYCAFVGEIWKVLKKTFKIWRPILATFRPYFRPHFWTFFDLIWHILGYRIRIG